MALLHVLAVRDLKADYYHRPIFTPSIGEAERSFMDECNRADQQNPLYLHPGDYELVLLGTFETQDASFDLQAKPKQIAVGVSIQK